MRYKSQKLALTIRILIKQKTPLKEKKNAHLAQEFLIVNLFNQQE